MLHVSLCCQSLHAAIGRFPLKGEKIRIFQFFSSNARVLDRIIAAISLQVRTALAGEVASVVSMVLSLRILDLTSHVVAPACSNALQTTWAYSYADGCGAWSGVAGGAGCDGVAAALRAWFAAGLAGDEGSGSTVPSAACAFKAPLGQPPSCWVITTPFGMVHFTWA